MLTIIQPKLRAALDNSFIFVTLLAHLAHPGFLEACHPHPFVPWPPCSTIIQGWTCNVSLIALATMWWCHKWNRQQKDHNRKWISKCMCPNSPLTQKIVKKLFCSERSLNYNVDIKLNSQWFNDSLTTATECLLTSVFFSVLLTLITARVLGGGWMTPNQSTKIMFSAS